MHLQEVTTMRRLDIQTKRGAVLTGVLFSDERSLNADTVMIVSRGLARESTRVPRWYNRPEVAMIELNPMPLESDR